MNEEVQQDCETCAENFNKRERKRVTCLHCNYNSCNKCIRRYLLSSINDASCMNCSKNWDREFLVTNLSKAWINGKYKKHREELLFERQKILLPSTQVYIKSKNQIKDNDKSIERINNEKKSELDKVYREIQKLYEKTNDIKRSYNQKMEVYKNNSMRHIRFINSTDEELEQPGKPDENEKVEVKEKEIIHGNCPVDDCKGYIAKGWVCGVCKVKVCSKCMEIKKVDKENKSKEKHKCDPGKVKNVEQLKKDSKPCPGCHILIYKISGCYQMYCTQCKTVFHWSTGEIIKNETIHNPHYLEYVQYHGNDLLRENGMCGDIDIDELEDKCSDYQMEKYYSLLQTIHHLRHYEMRNNSDSKIKKRMLRIDYMLNNIDDDQFKRDIQRIEKAENKKRDVNQVYDMFCNVSHDYLQALIDDKITTKKTNQLIKDLIEYSNIRLEIINKLYLHTTFNYIQIWQW